MFITFELFKRKMREKTKKAFFIIAGDCFKFF